MPQFATPPASLAMPKSVVTNATLGVIAGSGVYPFALVRAARAAGIPKIVAAAFVIDLPDLGGADRLRAKDVTVHTLVSFEGH